MSIICISLSVVCLIIAYKGFKELCPAKIFMYFWSIQILVMTILGHDYLIFKYSGIFFIICCLFFICLGATLAGGNYIKTTTVKRCGKVFWIDEKKIVKIILLLTIIGFIDPVQAILSQGFSLTNLLNFSSLLEINNNLSLNRYEGDPKMTRNVISQITGVFSYLGPLLGGFILPFTSSKKHKLLCYFSLSPQLFGGLTQGAKMGMITAVFVFLSGYLSSCFIINKKITIKWKSLLYGISFFLLFIGVLILSMMFRIGRFDIDTFYIVIGKFISYALGHLPAFDIWFDRQPLLSTDLTCGGKFFMGITNYLGIVERKSGIYDEFVDISLYGDQTNVYTIFRILIEDFGIIGTLIFFLLLGYFAQRMYINVRTLRRYKSSLTFIVAFYFLTSWSFVTSVFVYTSYIVMFFLFYYIINKYSKIIYKNEYH